MPKYWYDVTTQDLEQSTNGFIPLILFVGKLGSNMLAIGSTFEVQVITLWISTISTVGSQAKLASASSSWVGLASITSSWVGLIR